MKYLTDVILILLKFAEDDARDNWFHGITRMEKIIFLLQQEQGLDGWIDDDQPDFKAYKLGPYSQNVYTAIEFLNTYNLIRDTIFLGDSKLDIVEESLAFDHEHIQYSERRFRLTEIGRRAAATLIETTNNSIIDSIREYYHTFHDLPLTNLLRYVYRKYPQFTEKSEIKDTILGGPSTY